jgi:hypothetical protein
MSQTTEIAHQLSIDEIVEKRDKTVSMFLHGVESIEKALLMSAEIGSNAAYLTGWHGVKHKEFAKEFDKKIWRYLFNISGTSQLMNADQKSAFEESMRNEVPKVDGDTIRATLMMAKEERGETFVKGLIGVLQGICSTYANNKSFEVNKKLIFSGLNGWGDYAYRMKNRMGDLERMIHIANNEKPPEATVTNALYNMIGKADIKEFKYFTVRTFKNGNAHVLINCKGTLAKLNSYIADYYQGKGLPHEK